jgi:hypothetical protein
VLELDRAPKAKTLRRKLAHLTTADELSSSAKLWPNNGSLCAGAALGFHDSDVQDHKDRKEFSLSPDGRSPIV